MASGYDIERRIITGLIVSDEYIRKVLPFWRDDLLLAPEAQRIARWCIEHFEKYGKAPDRDIEAVYMDALRAEGLPKDEAEIIEIILQRISDDYGRGTQFNAAYLYDQTVRHFRTREITELGEELTGLAARGHVEEADEALQAYHPQSWVTARGLELGSEEGFASIERAFAESTTPVVSYPGALGDMFNQHLVRGGFVAFLAPEKRGKTFLMMDLCFRAVRKRANVVFFQAGDLNENQFLRRVGIYLTGRSDLERYCATHFRAVGDCVYNQYNDCDLDGRNCQTGIYEGDHGEWGRKESETIENLTEQRGKHPEYSACAAYECKRRWPTVWLQEEPEVTPLTGAAAAAQARRFFSRYRRRIKVATYPNSILTCAEIRSCLDEWERTDGFVADVIIVDYADIMTERVQDFRHRQDAIWRGLRGISQERHALLVTATQADAKSYKQNRLTMSNFTEDKRKLSHVTAMWGLNQSPDGREKRLGLLRVNEMVARESDFSADNEVVVMQDLSAGRSFLGSYRIRN